MAGASIQQLQPGDIVTKLDGKAINNATELRNDIAVEAPGSTVTLNVFRDGKLQDVCEGQVGRTVRRLHGVVRRVGQ